MDEKMFIKRQQHPEQKIIRTPYGGRIIVKMPHGNNIVIHFKDKDRIRHKKRWSQVKQALLKICKTDWTG